MNIHTGATHRVLNQARAATGWNAFSDDAVLQRVVTRGAPWVADKAGALGAHAGDAYAVENLSNLSQVAKKSFSQLL